ncbi:MAG: glycine dehydrogenase (aminomethyl-transferring), partial [Alphaproteobacteria bacterium HGW-Alphaproteobacteria-12]
MSGMNKQGRPTSIDGAGAGGARETFTGNRALEHEEPLLFELDNPGACGVDFDEPGEFTSHLGNFERQGRIGLARVSEPEVMRHFVRLSAKNYSIDAGLYPLGSCTMKHNPRLNEKMARLPGISDVHPLQPRQTVQGSLELMSELSHWLKELTGMPGVTLSPKAGAHGELCGMMAIRA